MIEKNSERDEDLAARIVALLREHMGITDPAIGHEATLQQLGMDGDDAVLFMTEFADRFRIDMRHFDLKRHFGSEGLWPSGLWKKRIPISIAVLIEAAKTRVWPGSEMTR